MPFRYDTLNDFDKGSRFRDACESLADLPQLPNKHTVMGALMMAGISEAPEAVVNAAQEAADYARHGVPRPVEGPLISTSQYFYN